jgi:hypothetical protein
MPTPRPTTLLNASVGTASIVCSVGITRTEDPVLGAVGCTLAVQPAKK